MVDWRRCVTCTEECPKAGTINETAKGRMFATNEFIALQKKVDSGQLVEVVRCRDCRWSRPLNRNDNYENAFVEGCIWCREHQDGKMPDDFCSDGERR